MLKSIKLTAGFRENLAHILHLLGATQRELGDASGKNQAWICGILSGKRRGCSPESLWEVYEGVQQLCKNHPAPHQDLPSLIPGTFLPFLNQTMAALNEPAVENEIPATAVKLMSLEGVKGKKLSELPLILLLIEKCIVGGRVTLPLEADQITDVLLAAMQVVCAAEKEILAMGSKHQLKKAINFLLELATPPEAADREK